ncbi:MAG: helix-turn-helix domain-containing protein [bacterium]
MIIHPLRQWLEKNNISSKEFGVIAGISRSHVNFIIAGERIPSLKLLKRILDATNNELMINDFININNKEDSENES